MQLEDYRIKDGRMALCDGCGFFPARYEINKVGRMCGMECIETELFGHGKCRWCGTKMENPYTTIDSRLCSPDCSANYYAHTLGDRGAALGTGKRFVAWMQAAKQEKKAKINSRVKRHRGVSVTLK